MTPVPADFQRVLNPWQSQRDIYTQRKTLEKMLKHKTPEERRELLRLDYPERDWSKPT